MRNIISTISLAVLIALSVATFAGFATLTSSPGATDRREPTPTCTPELPTATPEPTLTLGATSTNAPEPTPTTEPTQAPTATTEPTAEPTATIEPTATTEATVAVTDEPTLTPEPTPTPAALVVYASTARVDAPPALVNPVQAIVEVSDDHTQAAIAPTPIASPSPTVTPTPMNTPAPCPFDMGPAGICGRG